MGSGAAGAAGAAFCGRAPLPLSRTRLRSSRIARASRGCTGQERTVTPGSFKTFSVEAASHCCMMQQIVYGHGTDRPGSSGVYCAAHLVCGKGSVLGGPGGRHTAVAGRRGGGRGSCCGRRSRRLGCCGCGCCCGRGRVLVRHAVLRHDPGLDRLLRLLQGHKPARLKAARKHS